MFPLASPEDVGAAFHSRHSVHVPGIDNIPECCLSCDLCYDMSCVMWHKVHVPGIGNALECCVSCDLSYDMSYVIKFMSKVLSRPQNVMCQVTCVMSCLVMPCYDMSRHGMVYVRCHVTCFIPCHMWYQIQFISPVFNRKMLLPSFKHSSNFQKWSILSKFSVFWQNTLAKVSRPKSLDQSSLVKNPLLEWLCQSAIALGITHLLLPSVPWPLCARAPQTVSPRL